MAQRHLVANAGGRVGEPLRIDCRFGQERSEHRFVHEPA